MVQSFLSNLAVILLLHLVMVIFNVSKNPFVKKIFPLGIIIILSAATISISYLTIFSGEYYLDLKAVPLITLAYMRGWKPIIPVLIIVSLWRFFIGGDGAVLDIIFGLAAPTLFALLFHKKRIIAGSYGKKFFIASICWLISELSFIFTVPYSLEIYQEVVVFRYFSFMSAATILHTFIVIEIKRQMMSEQLTYFAAHDPLTGLLNKRAFFDFIEKELSDQTRRNCYIAMLDVDHFKKINDTLGHIFGDEVLKKMAEILKKYCSDKIQVARFGGEEFIVYLKNYTLEEVKEILNQIRKEISQIPFNANGDIFHITVSIGVSAIQPGRSLQTAIREADDRLYEAKEKGRNCLVFQ